MSDVYWLRCESALNSSIAHNDGRYLWMAEFLARLQVLALIYNWSATKPIEWGPQEDDFAQPCYRRARINAK